MRPNGQARRRSGLAVLFVLACLLVPAAPSVSTAKSSGAFVRVNQVGYPVKATKRAFLLASGDESGAAFSVLSGSTAVLTRAVGTDLGKWSQAFPHVYALNFGRLRTPGTYTIAVSGALPATSPPFRVATGAALYRKPLANALAFYRDERDGPHYLSSALRSEPAHLHDAHAMTYRTPNANSSGRFSGDLSSLGTRIDASGGWWDAGDYLKFAETSSYTVDLLLAGARDFPAEMGPGSSSSDFTNEARFGVRFLLRMWHDRTSTLYYQVGIGTGNSRIAGDHDIWRLPQDDDRYGGSDPRYRYIRHRPVFRAGPPGSPVSPNLAGRLAAAFAECSQVFRPTDLRLANRCLRAGEHVYDLADTSPSGHLLTVIPFSFYPEDEWQSDMELGATELSLATSASRLPASLPHTHPSHYLRRAAHWAAAYIAGPFDATDTLNLYDVSGLAHYDLYRAIARAGGPSGLEVSRGALLADMAKAIDGAVAQADSDPFRFGFPWDTWDTTSHGAGLSVMASEYDQLSRTDRYARWSVGWLDNILGANAWGTSLIVGDGTTFPHCMQHQVTNLVGSLDGSSPILAGAVVEGPNSTLYRGSLTNMVPCPPDDVDAFAAFNGGGAKYRDDVESFSTVEPAIDLTASSPLAFARQVEGLR